MKQFSKMLEACPKCGAVYPVFRAKAKGKDILEYSCEKCGLLEMEVI